MTKTPITDAEAVKIRNAIVRLRELEQTKIVTQDTEPEKRLLAEYLRKTAYEHLNELLGCWYVLHNEYEPLLHTLAPLVGRCFGMLQQRAATEPMKMDSKADAPVNEKEAPENVIPLIP